MTSGARAFLVAVTAAGAIGVGLAPTAAATPTTDAPVSPTEQSGCCETSPVETSPVPPTSSTSVVPPPTPTIPPTTSDPVYDPTLTAPATAERGTQIFVQGSGWPCAAVRVSPSWSESVDTQVGDRSFGIRIAVSEGAALGGQTIRVGCAASSYDRVERRTAIEILPAQIVTTLPTTAGPSVTTITESLVDSTSATSSPTTLPDGTEKQDSRLADALGLGAFLLALGGAALVTHRRRGRPGRSSPEHTRDALPPQVRVQVGDMRPSIHVREVAGPADAPAVRVRLTVGEPRLQVREVPR